MDSAKTIVCDCDGVLTDGKVWYDAKGNRTKGFHSRDIRAIRQLISHGYQFIIFTQSSWPGVKDFVNRTGAEVIIDREKSLHHFKEPFIAIGDDTPDLDFLNKAVKAYCPANADPFVKQTVKNITVLTTNGGEGVIAELVNKL